MVNRYDSRWYFFFFFVGIILISTGVNVRFGCSRHLINIVLWEEICLVAAINFLNHTRGARLKLYFFFLFFIFLKIDSANWKLKAES